ncbi:MAG: ABC transporter ATP-binding protein [Anaerolineae bacterium]|nr:ABC transporter ATP-binding protein [Anaerolineae bacterium]
MSDPILVADQLQMTYTAPDLSLEALAEADMAVMQHEFVCIIGPSGCGKSTLLRLLGGLVKPTAGRVLYRGRPLDHPCSTIGIVFQQPTLMPWRTVIKNVELPLQILGIPAKMREQRALAMLELVGLHDFRHSLPRELSGGMQQRVALARALVHQPDTLLLDEPFGSLDALTRELMNDELLRIWGQQRQTAIMITHDIQEAIYLADRVLVMSPRPGRILEEVPIHLPRPRDRSVLYNPRFAELARHLRAALHLGD